MRAKRSKKYRKIMDSYALSFDFHQPYQALLDAAFLQTCHAFHMPLRQYLENTLHGQTRFMVTQCTLAKIMRDHAKSEVRSPRPEFLPPPTELPLRYCKHEDKGEDWSEVDCLLDLIGGMPKGNEMKKNKWHYVLATADNSEEERRSRGYVDVRERARAIPGVPIVYVKRSVMVLEEMSGASLGFRDRLEKDKLRGGLVDTRKRKRQEEEDQEGKSTLAKEASNVRRGMRKAKGPNPLSVMKKKVKSPMSVAEKRTLVDGEDEEGKDEPTKKKRIRKHSKKQKAEEDNAIVGVMVAHTRLQEAVA